MFCLAQMYFKLLRLSANLPKQFSGIMVFSQLHKLLEYHIFISLIFASASFFSCLLPSLFRTITLFCVTDLLTNLVCLTVKQIYLMHVSAL